MFSICRIVRTGAADKPGIREILPTAGWLATVAGYSCVETQISALDHASAHRRGKMRGHEGTRGDTRAAARTCRAASCSELEVAFGEMIGEALCAAIIAAIRFRRSSRANSSGTFPEMLGSIMYGSVTLAELIGASFEVQACWRPLTELSSFERLKST